MIGQDVQDINFYVDTSDSINMELVTLFVEALVTFMETFKYTGINIGLWANGKPVGPFKVNCSKRRGKKGIITDINIVIRPVFRHIKTVIYGIGNHVVSLFMSN